MPPRQRVRLWDLPGAWIVQLLTRLNTWEVKQLFSTSTACRTLVLKHAPTTTLTFPLLERQSSMVSMLCSLQLASQHSKSISVCLEYGDYHIHEYVGVPDLKGVPWYGDYGPPARFMASDLLTNMASAFLRMASSAPLTVNITSLKLKGAALESPVPVTISEACPNLSSLTLQHPFLKCDRATASSFSAGFTNLQSLSMDQCSWAGVREGEGADWEQLLRQQVAQLMSLQKLSLAWSGSHTRYIVIPERTYLAILRGAAAQLTQLVLSIEVMEVSADKFWLQPDGATRLTALQHLVIADSTVRDAYLRVLLALPCLNQLEVQAFQLQDSFASHPVQWQQVTVHDLDVEQLTKMPLGNPALQLICKQRPNGAYKVNIRAGSDVSVINKALSNVSRCKGLKWQDIGVVLGYDWGFADPHLKEQLLKTSFLLLAGVRSLHLSNIDLSNNITQAICKFLEDNPACHHVCLGPSCKGSVLAWATIMSSIPCEGSISLSCHDESDITKLCCLAAEPVSLSAMHGYMVTVDERNRICKDVHAAMRMCGHQHVRLNLGDFPCSGH